MFIYKKIKSENFKEDITFAISFGFGYTLLYDDYVEENFGLKTALNLSNGKSIFSIENNDIRTFSSKSERKVDFNSSINDYEIDKFNDILTKISLKIKIFEKEVTASGKDSISFDWDVNLSTIDELLVEIYKNFKSDKYKEKYAWIDNIKNIKNSSLIDILNEKLVNFLKTDFLKDDYDNTKIFLDLNTNLEWDEIFEICITKKFRFKNTINILDLKKVLEKKLNNISLIFLKKTNIEIKDSNDNTQESSSIYKCLIFETDLNDKKYLLYKRVWYELKKTMLTKLINNEKK